MYKILIVGHGGFPTGVHSALDLVIGKQNNIDSMKLDEKVDHDALEKNITEYLDKNDHVIIFADISGGAPHQISAKAIHASGKHTQYVMSGAPVAALMQVALMCPDDKTDAKAVKEFLEDTLKEATSMSKVMSF